MKLDVILDGKAGKIEINGNGSQSRFSYERDGLRLQDQPVSLIECEPGIYSVLIEGRSYEAKVVSRGKGYEVNIGGHWTMVEVRDPRALSKKDRSGAADGPMQITSPMPGKVVRLLVAEGDTVEAGAGLVVVEAMKMQNEMKAPKAGRVVSLTAREGSTVGAGETLALIE